MTTINIENAKQVPAGLAPVTPALSDYLIVNGGKATIEDVLALGGGNTTQTVTTSPATVAARFIVLDDDSHTSGAPGSLVMPPITAGAWHVINTPYEDVHYLVTKAPGDPVNTGPDLTIDSTVMRQQQIFVFAAVSEGVLRWQYDSTGYAITQLYEGLLLALAQTQALARPYSDFATHTETAATYTWSDGISVKRLVIDRNASKPEITLDESDWEDGTTCRLDIADSGGLGVTIALANPLNTINGMAAGVGYTTLPGSDLVGGMPPSYEVSRADGGVWTIRAMVDVAAVVGALEAIATTPLSSTTGTTLSWEAQERVRLANTGTTHCLVTLNGDTDEWPVGRARALSQYGSTTGGFTLAVPSGHKLNTVTNGTSGVIGTTPADDGTALYTVMVTREASDEWSWA
jgi:hypothetical protein